MEAIEFIEKYQDLLDMLAVIAAPEYQREIENMRKEDPHEMVGPQNTFTGMSGAIGYLFIKLYKKVFNK